MKGRTLLPLIRSIVASVTRLARIFKLIARCHYLGAFAGIGCFSARGGVFCDWASVIHDGSHVDVLV